MRSIGWILKGFIIIIIIINTKKFPSVLLKCFIIFFNLGKKLVKSQMHDFIIK